MPQIPKVYCVYDNSFQGAGASSGTLTIFESKSSVCNHAAGSLPTNSRAPERFGLDDATADSATRRWSSANTEIGSFHTDFWGNHTEIR
ncbi:hypothetical protein GCM10023346_43760 [Arthrobacter gyeryongensis]|uniref:Uncharacterized protein n=1 Tax=Arthrobacter gyeryongensis TaxID=1650592 RepID=A0ABP9SU77_9MICC